MTLKTKTMTPENLRTLKKGYSRLLCVQGVSTKASLAGPVPALAPGPEEGNIYIYNGINSKSLNDFSNNRHFHDICIDLMGVLTGWFARRFEIIEDNIFIDIIDKFDEEIKLITNQIKYNSIKRD